MDDDGGGGSIWRLGGVKQDKRPLDQPRTPLTSATRSLANTYNTYIFSLKTKNKQWHLGTGVPPNMLTCEVSWNLINFRWVCLLRFFVWLSHELLFFFLWHWYHQSVPFWLELWRWTCSNFDLCGTSFKSSDFLWWSLLWLEATFPDSGLLGQDSGHNYLRSFFVKSLIESAFSVN